MKMIIKQINDNSIEGIIKKYNLPEKVELEYPELDIVVEDLFYSNDDEWDEEVTLKDYSYYVKTIDLMDYLGDFAVDDLPEDLANEYDKYWHENYQKADELVNEYMGTHFKELIEKHYNELLEIYREQAKEYASDNYNPEDFMVSYDDEHNKY